MHLSRSCSRPPILIFFITVQARFLEHGRRGSEADGLAFVLLLVVFQRLAMKVQVLQVVKVGRTWRTVHPFVSDARFKVAQIEQFQPKQEIRARPSGPIWASIAVALPLC